MPKHEQAIKSASDVINTLVINNFKKVEKKGTHTDTKENLIQICEAMATLGSDNANELLDGKPIEGRFTGDKFDYERLHLRNIIMKKAYPTYADFEAAVIKNMQITPEKEIILSTEDATYLQLQYAAISNNMTRDMLYDTLTSELDKVQKEIKISTAPERILNAIKEYKNDLSNNTNKQKLKQALSQSLELLVGEDINWDVQNEAVNYVVDNIKNYRDNITKIETKQILLELKNDYNAQIKKPSLRPGGKM
jgi:hypothetical protein